MKNLQDLRFVIGLFFGIISLILLVTSFLVQASAQASESGNLNMIAGIGMLIFSAFMLISAITDRG